MRLTTGQIFDTETQHTEVRRRPHGSRCAPASRLVIADHDITMTPGEEAEFDTQVPHWFGPAGDRPDEILSILGREGERIHVRASPRRKTAGRWAIRP